GFVPRMPLSLLPISFGGGLAARFGSCIAGCWSRTLVAVAMLSCVRLGYTHNLAGGPQQLMARNCDPEGPLNGRSWEAKQTGQKYNQVIAAPEHPTIVATARSS